ncbi:transposase [Micromonospora aurantiaca (nom. illeg.)]|uniref:transposase n=1 Tax=Micromonospora aurantiaca (nom. illeg.) TaxID=47850 RepID=UPI00160D3546
MTSGRRIGAVAGNRREQVRHRLSRAGNRQINRVLHIMATVQLRSPTEGRAYFDWKKASGKTSWRRCAR